MGQVISTLGLRDTFVTITIPYLHFSTSKHVLQITHILQSKQNLPMYVSENSYGDR